MGCENILANLDKWQAFMAVFYPLVIVGMFIDRYWLMKPRIIDQMIGEMKERGCCSICKRPMKVVEDEHVHE